MTRKLQAYRGNKRLPGTSRCQKLLAKHLVLVLQLRIEHLEVRSLETIASNSAKHGVSFNGPKSFGHVLQNAGCPKRPTGRLPMGQFSQNTFRGDAFCRIPIFVWTQEKRMNSNQRGKQIFRNPQVNMHDNGVHEVPYNNSWKIFLCRRGNSDGTGQA